MIDYFKAKGDFFSYQLDSICIIRYSYRNKKSGGMIYRVDIPNSAKSEFLELKIVEVSNGNKVFIEGNFRKWMYGNKSAVRDLSYGDYCFCIKVIARRLGVLEDWIWNLELTYIEMGGNIKLPRGYERFIPGLFSYPELHLERWSESSVYFTGVKYSLIFYDKLKEMRDRNIISGKVANKLINKFFILRFEIKINAKSGYRKKNYIRNLGLIRENWNLLLDDWVDTFEKAKPVDLFSDSVEVKKGTLSKRQTFDYCNFILVDYIGLDRGLYHFQYFMKNRKSEAVDYIQYLFKKYKTGEKWNFYENIIAEVKLKKNRMKIRSSGIEYNNKKTTTKTV